MSSRPILSNRMQKLIREILNDDRELVPLLTTIMQAETRRQRRVRRQLKRMEAYTGRTLTLRIVAA